jgi:hypothetical protein
MTGAEKGLATTNQGRSLDVVTIVNNQMHLNVTIK